MKTSIAACLLLLNAPLSGLPVFIGTNTGKGSESKGIYLADFDLKTGRLTEPKLAVESRNPGFLALHPTKPVLYACGQPRTDFSDRTGAVAAFSVSADHRLAFLGEASSRGLGPCHIAVDATGKSIAVANYGDGMIASIKLDQDGLPRGIGTFVLEAGSGPHPRQKGPHAHGVYFDKSNRFLFVPDLGADIVYAYKFDAQTSTLMPAAGNLETAPGAGPRHLAFSPDGKHAYVINELDCTILVASHENGNLKAVQSIPIKLNPSSRDTAAEIEVSENGRFVYASLRAVSDPTNLVARDAQGREIRRDHLAGDKGNTLSVFSRNPESGRLSFVERVYCGGKTPRHFKIAPGGRWLLSAHQGSHTISVFPLDPDTGKLGGPASTVASPSPTCILFAK